MSFTYGQRLASPQWQEKRKEILTLDKYKCRLCKSENNLQVHHLVYLHGVKPWDYPVEMLVTICEPCHKKEEKYKKLIGILIPELTSKGISCVDIFNHLELLNK